MNIFDLIKSIKPSAFPNDWEGWMANQAGHMMLGLTATMITPIVLYLYMGELPNGFITLSLIFVLYLSYELRFQGWQGADTVEDVIFVVAYGAGIPLLVFTELERGSSLVVGDILEIFRPFLLIAAHMAIGIISRWKKE